MKCKSNIKLNRARHELLYRMWNEKLLKLINIYKNKSKRYKEIYCYLKQLGLEERNNAIEEYYSSCRKDHLADFTFWWKQNRELDTV